MSSGTTVSAAAVAVTTKHFITFRLSATVHGVTISLALWLLLYSCGFGCGSFQVTTDGILDDL